MIKASIKTIILSHLKTRRTTYKARCTPSRPATPPPNAKAMPSSLLGAVPPSTHATSAVLRGDSAGSKSGSSALFESLKRGSSVASRVACRDKGGGVDALGGAAERGALRLHCGVQAAVALLWSPEAYRSKREGTSRRGWLALPLLGHRVLAPPRARATLQLLLLTTAYYGLLLLCCYCAATLRCCHSPRARRVAGRAAGSARPPVPTRRAVRRSAAAWVR